MRVVCEFCQESGADHTWLARHMLGCKRRVQDAPKPKLQWTDLSDGGNTDSNSVIEDEIDMLAAQYNDSGFATVRNPNQLPILQFDLDVEDRLYKLQVAFVQGYPYHPPNIQIAVLRGSEPIGAVLDAIKRKIAEIAAAQVGNCYVQSLVESVRETLLNPQLHAPTSVRCTATPDSMHGATSSEAPGTPLRLPMAVTDCLPSAANTRELKLQVFLLHVLQKHATSLAKGPSESEDLFRSYADHLLHDVRLLDDHVVAQYSAMSIKRYFKDFFEKDLAMHLKQLWGGPSFEASAGVTGTSGALEEGGDPGLTQNSRYRREYEQLDRLGEGAFGAVFSCRKKVDGRLYAVKRVVMKKKHAVSTIREVRTLARFQHPNIIRYYDAWIESGTAGIRLPSDSSESESGTESGSESDFSVSREADRADAEVEDGGEAGAWHQQEGDAKSVSSSDSSGGDHFFGVGGTDNSSSSSESEQAPSHVDPVPTTSRSALGSVDGIMEDGPDAAETLYICTEHCQSKTLKDAINEGVFVGNEDLMNNILRQLLSAVQYIHDQGAMHRDLKPANILFAASSAYSDIKVADFGLARDDGSKKQRRLHSGVFEASSDLEAQYLAGPVTEKCGTLLYAAPEQLRPHYSSQVDEYALGLIAYEMWLSALGKDYRERLMLMEDLRRTETLPDFFLELTSISGIISRLTKRNPQERATAAQILASESLPGDPAEITQAMQVVSDSGGKIANRLVPRLKASVIRSILDGSSDFVVRPSQGTIDMHSQHRFALEEQIHRLALIRSAVSLNSVPRAIAASEFSDSVLQELAGIQIQHRAGGGLNPSQGKGASEKFQVILREDGTPFVIPSSPMVTLLHYLRSHYNQIWSGAADTVFRSLHFGTWDSNNTASSGDSNQFATYVVTSASHHNPREERDVEVLSFLVDLISNHGCSVKEGMKFHFSLAAAIGPCDYQRGKRTESDANQSKQLESVTLGPSDDVNGVIDRHRRCHPPQPSTVAGGRSNGPTVNHQHLPTPAEMDMRAFLDLFLRTPLIQNQSISYSIVDPLALGTFGGLSSGTGNGLRWCLELHHPNGKKPILLATGGRLEDVDCPLRQPSGDVRGSYFLFAYPVLAKVLTELRFKGSKAVLLTGRPRGKSTKNDSLPSGSGAFSAAGIEEANTVSPLLQAALQLWADGVKVQLQPNNRSVPAQFCTKQFGYFGEVTLAKEGLHFTRFGTSKSVEVGPEMLSRLLSDTAVSNPGTHALTTNMASWRVLALGHDQAVPSALAQEAREALRLLSEAGFPTTVLLVDASLLQIRDTLTEVVAGVATGGSKGSTLPPLAEWVKKHSGGHPMTAFYSLEDQSLELFVAGNALKCSKAGGQGKRHQKGKRKVVMDSE